MSQDDLEALYAAEKMLATAPIWVERDAEMLEVVCPIEIDRAVREGCIFRLIARKSCPDEMITAQLEYHPPTEAGGALHRIEWRPISGHNNRGLGPKEYRNKIIHGCHHHPFEVNQRYAPAEVKRGRLPVALPLNPSPGDFDALLDFVSTQFRITNIQWIEVPPWEPRLV